MIEGDITYPYIAEKLPLVLGQEVYQGYNNIISRPIYLPKIDTENAVTINPEEETKVTTAAIPGAEVVVSAGSLERENGEMYTGKLSITQVTNDLTPAALPPNLVPDLVVTIQPGKMVFNTPAPLSLLNLAGYAPGTIMDLWSINPETGDFDKVGVARVSEDGTVVETIERGMINSSWHFVAPPPEEPEDPDLILLNLAVECNDCFEIDILTSEVEFYSGGVIETHELVPYQSLGVNRGLTLTYDSLRADPRPILHFGYENVPFRTNLRVIASLEITKGKFSYEVPGYTGSQFGLRGGEHFWSIPEEGGNIDVALQADLSNLPSGEYQYKLIQGLRVLTPLRARAGTIIPPVFAGSSTTITGSLIH